MGGCNTYRYILIFLIPAIVLSLVMAATCYSANGVLLLVKGGVAINSYGIPFPAGTGLRLKPGDTVKGLGGTASILLSDGSIHKVNKGSSFTLPVKEEEGPMKILALRLMDAMRETAHMGSGGIVDQTTREKRELILINPHNSFIAGNQPGFEWEGVEAMEDIEIFVKCPYPAYKYAFQSEPGKNKATLPKEAPRLLPDVKYYWKVKGLETRLKQSYTSKLCWFAIPGKEKVDKIREDKKKIDQMGGLDIDDKEVLKATLFISYSLYHSAERIMKKVLQKFPEDQGLKRLLLGLYIRMKKFDEAKKLI
ncbi:MAG: tetratricopeptide repeat protein [Thermodesulfobacteriota bacterium]|nr:tetratricopeptide repeat protein [Thermodesulfobacteriota bacterium]